MRITGKKGRISQADEYRRKAETGRRRASRRECLVRCQRDTATVCGKVNNNEASKKASHTNASWMVPVGPLAREHKRGEKPKRTDDSTSFAGWLINTCETCGGYRPSGTKPRVDGSVLPKAEEERGIDASRKRTKAWSHEQ